MYVRMYDYVRTSVIVYCVIKFSFNSFSQAKKCSNEGRALMQLDFQQYRTQIEKISHIRFVSAGVL